jgi:ABC-type lipoprotein release transport system permease subunit
MFAKILTIVVGAAFAATLIGILLGITISALTVGGLGLTLLIRRDWVPVVYNLRSLTVRKVTTSVTAVGIALVVFVFATVLMLASGVKKTLATTGVPENAKINRKGAQNEMQSGMLPEQLKLLEAQPEVAIGKDGKPLASPELVVLIFALKEGATDDSQGTNVTVRGVGPKALDLHPPAHLDGRMFTPGTSEVVIGKGLAGRFQGMKLGGATRFARRDWTVVGVMDTGGSAYESEVWGDVEQFEDAFQRRPAFSSVTIKLASPDALEALSKKLDADPQLNSLEVKREDRYWAGQSERFALFVTFLGLFVAVIFAFGAVLGAMITMYAQVAARTREIGTLRAMGFRRRSVLVSFIVESVLLSLIAGSLGLFAASFWQLTSFSTMNWQSFSEVTFRFHLSPEIIAASLTFAALLGYAGGLLPALRASRMPITQATRGG